MRTDCSKVFRNVVVALWLSALLFPFFIPISASAAVIPQYQAMSPAELYQRSIDTPSAVERAMMRGHLAAAHPETAEGKFGAAWIAARNDLTDEVTRLYEDAIRVNPNLVTPYINLGFTLDSSGQHERALEIYRRGLEVGPEDTLLIRNIFFLMRWGSDGPAGAEKFLNEQEAAIGSDHYAFDFIRGIEQQIFGDRNEAVRYLESAVEKGAPFEVLERLTDLRFQHFTPPSASVDEMFQHLRPVQTYAESRNDARAYLYLARQMHERFNARSEAFQLYRQAFRSYPTPEAAVQAFELFGNYGFNAALDFLEEADRVIPSSYKIKQTLGWAHSTFYLMPEAAERYYQSAFDLAPHDGARQEIVTEFGVHLENLGRFDEALDFYHQAQSRFVSAGEQQVLPEIIVNRLGAQRFQEAGEALERRRAMGNLNDTWYDLQRSRIDNALALDNERRRFLDENPFLQEWDARFGESLSLSIEFPINSDVIPQSAHGVLGNAASALQTAGGDRYIFLVEGHTDITGTDAINLPLSDRRAAAVVRHLRENHGLEASRLRSVGHGPRHPIATNETEAGRSANRRVEIRPYGNISDPEVAVTSSLDASRLALSPDGRFAAIGYYPVQIWDVRQGVRVRDLFRGAGRDFSPNGRYVAAISNYTEVGGSVTNMLYVYDAKTGHAVAQLYSPNEIRRLAWSPFSDEVAFVTISGFLKIYNIAERRLRGVTRLSDTRTASVLTWLPGGDRIATSEARGSDIKLWNAHTLDLEQTLPGVSWAHAIGATRDGRLLYAFDNNRTLSVWDLHGAEMRPRQMQSPMTPVSVISHPERPWVVFNAGFNRDGGGGIGVIDLERMEVVATRASPDFTDVGVSPDGEFVYGAWDNAIHTFEIETLNEAATIASQAPVGQRLAIDRRNQQLVSGDDDGSHVWSLTTGRKVHSMTTRSDLGFRQLTDGEGRFVTVDDSSRIVVFDGRDFSETRLSDIPMTVTDIEVGADHVVFIGRTNGVEAAEQREAQVHVYAKADLLASDAAVRPVARFTVPLVTGALQYAEFRGALVQATTMDDDRGLMAISSSWQDGFGAGYTFSRMAQIYDLRTGDRIQTITHDNDIFGMEFLAGEDDALRIDGRGQARVYDVVSGNEIRWAPRPSSTTIAIETGDDIEWSWDFVRVGDRQEFFPGTVRSVVADPEKNLVVALTNANALIFMDIETLTRHLTIVAKADDEWIAYTPHGEFAASRRGAEGVFWSLGDNYLPFDALRDRFESPQLVQRHLARLFEGVDTADIPQPEIEADLFDMPYSVSLASPQRLETTDDAYTLSLRVEMLQSGLADPQFEYTHNGRIIPRARGFDEDVSFFDDADDIDANEIVGIDRRFELDEGFNLIEASLVYRGARLDTQRVEIIREVEPSVADNRLPPQIRPTTQLWYFGVGISEYEIENQNLNYAHRDALALQDKFKAQEGLLYSQVNTRVLTNEEATERNVRIELNDFLRRASAEDVIVIFVAGHGVRDNDQHLYLITHEADMDRPYTGMSMGRFHDLLTARPINQKAIFMMDICHAGSFGPQRRGRVTIEDAVDQLAQGTGTIVLASSTGSQSSLEHEDYGGGHGAFTAALLEGLAGRADIEAGNSDGFVSIQELMSYAARRVPDMTDFRQHPTIPMMENVRDFPMTAVNF